MAFFDAKYYSPDFTIKINGSDLVKDKYIAVKAVTLEIKIGQADTFSFTVQDEMVNGKFKWVDDDLFKEGNEVTVKMGYAGSMPLSTTAHISELAPDFSPGLAPTFTVTGRHKAYSKLTQPCEQSIYIDKTDSGIVSAIAEKVGLTPKADGTSPQWKNKRKPSNVSFLSFIEEMVTQNMQYEFYVADGTLYFTKAKTSGGPALTLEWGKTLKQLKPKVDNSKIVSGVEVKWWDQENQENIFGNAGDTAEVSVGDGSKNAAKMVQNRVMVVSNIVAKDNSNAGNQAAAILQHTNRYFVTCDGDTLGIPALVPGIMIKIKNLEEKYPTTFYVYGAKHTIDESGYKTAFSARANTYNA